MSSKIKVDTIENVAGSGNVSLGSGHNLVVPGNITGQGTAAITSNATVGGTLGVTGTQTNNGNFVVSKAIPNVDIKDTGTAQASMDFLSNSDTVRATIGMERSAGGGLFVGSSAYSAVFGTASSGNTEFATNNNIRMTIDSSGRVTTPNQPMFALKNTGNSTHYKQASVQIDQGSHWDNVNGRFTAPIAGKYFFFAGIQSSGAGAFYWGLYKNGTLQTSFYNDPSGGTYLHASVAQIISLAASDYVEFKMAGSQAANTGGQNHFSGFLIG